MKAMQILILNQIKHLFMMLNLLLITKRIIREIIIHKMSIEEVQKIVIQVLKEKNFCNN